MNGFRLLISVSVLSMALVAGSIVLRISVHETVLYHEYTHMSPLSTLWLTAAFSCIVLQSCDATQLSPVGAGYFRVPRIKGNRQMRSHPASDLIPPASARHATPIIALNCLPSLLTTRPSLSFPPEWRKSRRASPAFASGSRQVRKGVPGCLPVPPTAYFAPLFSYSIDACLSLAVRATPFVRKAPQIIFVSYARGVVRVDVFA
jgi:hypothetical protein